MGEGCLLAGLSGSDWPVRPRQRLRSREAYPDSAEMWNPLRENDSAAVPGRRPRLLCAGALVLASGLFILGFLFGRGAFAKQTSEPPRAVPRFRDSRACSKPSGVLSLVLPRGGCLEKGNVPKGSFSLTEHCSGAL